MKHLIVALLTLGTGSAGYGQNCHAAFTYTAAGQAVSFVDQSTPSSHYDYWWTFGDGNSSNQQNPTHTYAQPGTYAVCLFIYDSNVCQSVYCDSVTVGGITPWCHALFTATGWPGPVYQFHDQSTASGSILSWMWDFGDGGTSTQQNPSHVYAHPGGYQVCLTIVTVDSNHTCTSVHCDSIWVSGTGICPDSSVIDTTRICQTIHDPVCGCDSVTYDNSCVAYYYHGITQWTQGACGSNCHAAFTVIGGGGPTYQFHDQSTASHQIAQWFWDFGDGTTSNQQHPVHIYQHNGFYQVCLTIVTADSCSSTTCHSVWVTGSGGGCHAAFTVTTWAGTTFSFHDQSTASSQIVYWSWDFGDGNSSTLQNPVHTYSQQGLYLVCLTIFTADSCTDTYCDSMWVGNQPCPDPSVIDTTRVCPTIYDPVCGCDSVTYDNSCIAYFWYGITQWTPGPCGQSSSCQAQFSHQSNGLTVSFTDVSTAGGTIIGWWWDFGDGNGSISQNPVYTYTNAGLYLVCLTIITSDSCFSTWCDTITVMTSGVEETQPRLGLSISPNPARAEVQLALELVSAAPVVIAAYDVSGRRVASIYAGMIAQGSSVVTWDVSSLNDGVYLVRVLGEALDVSRKVVVMQ